MHVRRSLVACALAPLLLGLALSGCQEAEPTPKMPETAASSATPTETPSAEQESPEDFIRRWVALDKEMQNTGKTRDYMQVSSSCAPCAEVAERVEGIFHAGGYVRTKGWVILGIKDRSPAVGPKVFDLRVRSTPTTYKESAESAERTLSGGVLSYRLRLNSSTPWRIVNLNQLAA